MDLAFCRKGIIGKCRLFFFFFVLNGNSLKCLLKENITFQTSFLILILGTCQREAGKCEINEDGARQRRTHWKAEGRNRFIKQSKRLLSYMVLSKEGIKESSFSVLLFMYPHPLGKVGREIKRGDGGVFVFV